MSGCVSTIYTGVTSVYDHYSLEEDVSNGWVNLKAIDTLNSNKEITQNSSISVTTLNYVVLLTGQTRTEALRQATVSLVSHVTGVRRVINAIRVSPPLSGRQSLKNSWISTKIKSKMLVNGQIDSSSIKVVTVDNGVVFLMGIVTPDMATRIIALAQNTAGVTKVIRLFQIMTVRAE